MRYSLSLFMLVFSCWASYGQNRKMVFPDLANKDVKIHKGSKLFTTVSDGTLLPREIKDDWGISLKHKSTFFHNSEYSLEAYKKLKTEANELKNSTNVDRDSYTKPNRMMSIAPVLINDFRGNIRENSIPMDNTMAVSRNGFVVSAINSNIIFAMPDGEVTFSRGFADFYKVLGLGTRMFDPRVIFDPEQNRFIVVCLHGSDPSTSYLCLAFSKTEDPNGEWNFYKIKGDVLADDVWFDFPNIGVSKEDLYIAGNMFSDDNGFRYSMILQISKDDAYEGKEITWKYYDRVSNVDNGLVFNPVPAMSGWKILTSPGMYFISNGNGGFNINYTDASVKNDPSLISLKTTGPNLTFPPEGRQKDIPVLLNTGGNRIRTAMYQNGILHFSAQSNSPSGDGGLYYGRMNMSDLAVTADILSVPDQDLAYPTLTSFGNREEDEQILINYTFTGTDVYPGQAARVISGSGPDFDWSDEIVYKPGLSSIGSIPDESVRWGDYSGACRRFGVNRIESWAVGCFGEGRSHGTWIGQLIHSDNNDKPILEFTASKTTERKDSVITFRDITNAIPKSRQWIFEGGTPETSNEEFPKVIYSQNGSFNVTLISVFESHSDTMTKIAFIHIQDPETLPVALWVSDKDTIYIGDSIQFSSLSSANALFHKWNFVQGSPMNSEETNPIVKYNKKGSFTVALTVRNNAGSNSYIVNKAITVFEKTAPLASFTSDKTIILPGDSIVFADKSKGSKNVKWYFSGGEPSTSTSRSPIIRYPEQGVFPVKMVVNNDFGTDSLTIESYVSVGTSGTLNEVLLSDVRLFPNPSGNNSGSVTLAFSNFKTGIYKIDLFTNSGQFIKSLYADKIKSGENELSFRTNMLSAGSYFISLSSEAKVIKTLPLVILE